MKVLAAMSGGVDSAVAAARAVDAGHDVVGVHLALAREPAALRAGARGCCTVEDAHDARRAADVLGIPFYVWDLSERFEADVVEDFLAEYAAGRTPNPCVRCNERIKFSALLDKGLALGFDAVCTGHYARVLVGGVDIGARGVAATGVAGVGGGAAAGAPGVAGQVDRPGATSGVVRELHRAVDLGKDQSYVLAVLAPARLAHALFPLGDTLKPDVRAEAAARGLAVAAKPDSHDICFVADGDTKAWLARRLGARPGPVVDAAGEPVGEHDGAYAYTVGQRHGLRLGRPAADGRPRYVLSIEPVTNTVTVGPREALAVRAVEGRDATWCGPAAVAGQRVQVQVRAHAGPVLAAVAHVGTGADTLLVQLDEPIIGVAPGQTMALYDRTRVVGSATITV